MKLRTSFFNTTVLRKDITRFAPVWGLYTLFMLIVLFFIWSDESEPARFAANAQYIMSGMGVVNFGYAGICALLLFGDLFSSKMTGMLHAMPLRREGWFLTHLCSGMLFCFVPNALGAVLASMILQEYCYLAFLWLGIMLLQFLFFFGTAAFSIQCAGNRLGAAAVYGLFNLVSVLVAFFVDTFYIPVLHGLETNWEAICTRSPVVGFSTFQYIAVEYDNMYGISRFEGFLPEQWRYLLVAASVGLGLIALSVLLYRRRQLESAGDFIAVKPVAPVFLALYALGVGGVLYFLADQLAPGAAYLFLILGFAIGLFTGCMLLEKRVNVFQMKKWIYLGTMILAFFLTVTVVRFDPIGITRYVPKTSQIESVQISPYASSYYLEHESLVLTDTAEIQNVQQIHKTLIQNRREKGSVWLRLRYNLKNGGTVDRVYRIESEDPVTSTLKPYFSRFAFVTGFKTPEELLNRIELLEFYNHHEAYSSFWINCIDQEELFSEKYGQREGWPLFSGTAGKNYARALIEAVYADCQAENMAQMWEFHPYGESVGNLTIAYRDGFTVRYMDMTVYPDCENTINFLKSLPKE